MRKGSLLKLPLALTAEATFFSHGLFTAVEPPEDGLVVNLRQGDGPTLARDTHLIRSTVVVAGTGLWGTRRCRRSGVAPRGELVQVPCDLSLQLVVKPHPLDADAYQSCDLLVLQHDRRRDSGVTPYRTAQGSGRHHERRLQRLDRVRRAVPPGGVRRARPEGGPRRRGLNVPELAALLPGPRITSAQDAQHFLEVMADVLEGVGPSLCPTCTEIGVAHAHGVAGHLPDWLDTFQCERAHKSLLSVPRQGLAEDRAALSALLAEDDSDRPAVSSGGTRQRASAFCPHSGAGHTVVQTSRVQG